jgi:hypothetical protein
VHRKLIESGPSYTTARSHPAAAAHARMTCAWSESTLHFKHIARVHCQSLLLCQFPHLNHRCWCCRSRPADGTASSRSSSTRPPVSTRQPTPRLLATPYCSPQCHVLMSSHKSQEPSTRCQRRQWHDARCQRSLPGGEDWDCPLQLMCDTTTMWHCITPICCVVHQLCRCRIAREVIAGV